MKYLLIDFGASHIKSVLYNDEKKSFEKCLIFPSFFLQRQTIEKKEVKCFIDQIIEKYPQPIDNIFSCSILGGYYVGDTYYSWKCSERPSLPENPKCLISGLFEKSTLHESHARSLSKKASSDIRTIGTYKGVPFLSSLGDTECALNAAEVSEGKMIINMGTGSQIVFKGHRQSFIPSGRMFLVFDNFFRSLGKDFFSDLSELKLEDLLRSSLKMDLKIYEQAHNFKNGGSIAGILESNFTYKNILASLLKSYAEQYAFYIKRDEPKSVFLMGGISQKLSVVGEYLVQLFPQIHFQTFENKYPETLVGMANFLENFSSNEIA